MPSTNSPRHLGTIGYGNNGTRFAWLCRFIGHSWRNDTPERLRVINSPHRRVRCKRCTIRRWRFRAKTQEELEDIMTIGSGMNREARRKALNQH